MNGEEIEFNPSSDTTVRLWKEKFDNVFDYVEMLRKKKIVEKI